MRKAEITASVFLIVLGLAMIFVVIPRQTSPGERYGLPPATLPTVAMVVVTGLAALLLVRKLTEKRPDQTPSPITRANWRHIIVFTVLLFLSLAAIKYLHFVLGGMPILAALMLIMGNRRPVVIALVSILTPGLIYVALWYGLRIPLP